MSCNVELSEEETLCLHQYFERVDHTEDLSFIHPAEYMAFQRIAGQVCKASAAMLQSSCNRLLQSARDSVSGPWTCAAASSDDEVEQTRPFAERARCTTDDNETRIGVLLRELRIAFEHRNPDAANALCTRDAKVVSPSHGAEPASAFLARTLASGRGIRLRFHDVRTNIEGRPQAIGHLSVDGVRVSGNAAEDEVDRFDVAINVDDERTKVRSVIVFQRLRVEVRESELTP